MRTLYLMFPEKIGTIDPKIYGHFSEHIGGVIYDGIYVGRDSEVDNVDGFRTELIRKLREINPPVLRWPGGCYAEQYDWRDGIGKDRPTRLNWWTYADGRYESNEVGTHEFLRFCDLIGAEPYLAANMTSLPALAIRNWIEYCNAPEGSTTLAKERAENGHPTPFGVRYWGIGNENYGCGGNMRPQYYADRFRRFAELAANVPGDVQLILAGSYDNNFAYTRGLMEGLADSDRPHRWSMAGFSLHYYCGSAGDPLTFSRDEWYELLRRAARMDEYIGRHWHAIASYGMDRYLKLVIDEWGCWHPDGSGPSKGKNLFEQQSTMRDAMVTALTLNIFNNHCDKIMMANAAQLVNNLHCLFLSAGQNCITTPTYEVFHMYREHQGGQAIRTAVSEEMIPFRTGDGRADEIDDLSVSASVSDGYVTVSIANLSIEGDAAVQLLPVGEKTAQYGTVTTLAEDDPHACNTFEEPDRVRARSEEKDLTKPLIIPKGGIACVRMKIAERE